MLSGLVLAASLIHAQPQEPLKQEIAAEDWAISDWSGIRLGQVSIIHKADGDELRTGRLRLEPRVVYSGPRRSGVPRCDGNCLLVDSFDSGAGNRLGGYFSSFSGKGSAARVSIRRWDDGRRALTIHYENQAGGWSGAWVHLFDFTLPGAERVFFDSTGFSYLTFWIRGRSGGERVLLKAADARWEAKQDALPAGEVARFVETGAIDRSWRRARVPLSALDRRLNRRELAVVVFQALGTGAGEVAVKDIAFCKKAEALRDLGPPRRGAVPERKRDRALWVWNTRDIIESAGEQRDLVQFAGEYGFTDLFLQLTGASGNTTPHGEIRLEAEKWKPFLALLNRHGFRAHALDGFNQYALPEWHDAVLKTVRNVIAYNRSVQPHERFYGIHYDVEPYLVRGFAGPLRGRIVSSYLELLSKMSAETRPAGIPFGVDMPFWFDTRDEVTGELPVVEFHGVSGLLSEHVIDQADSVAVMDYRTYAFGADGLLSLAKGELEYAAKKGKRLFVGLETTPLPDEDLVEFEGAPALKSPETSAADRAIVISPDGAGATIRLVGRSEWPMLSKTGGKLLWWPVARTVRVPGDKLSFAQPGISAMQQAMGEAEEDLAAYPSFAGFAIHDYLGYRSLLDRKKQAGMGRLGTTP
ncbi:MAG TPA: carbohydrate binding domain-containing protein [Bryobacteraceae bacterium]|nr:carbohydrate binding domain-containing protein [Bryobacteraceae bacterium]